MSLRANEVPGSWRGLSFDEEDWILVGIERRCTTVDVTLPHIKRGVGNAFRPLVEPRIAG